MKKKFNFNLLLICLLLTSCNKEKTTQGIVEDSTFISGKVTCQNGQPLEGVKFLVNKDEGVSQSTFFTSADGSYKIKRLVEGANYTIEIDYTDATINDENDLTSLTEILTDRSKINAFLQVAGDINRSGTITAFDREMLKVKIENEEPLAWRVLPADLEYNRDNQSFIYADDFSRTLSLMSYDGTPIEQDFVAVKLGDLDKSICD